MNRRVFTLSVMGLMVACESSSKTTSTERGKEMEDDGEESQKKKTQGTHASPERGVDLLAGWVTGTVDGVSVKFPETPESKGQETLSVLAVSTSAGDNYWLLIGQLDVDVDEAAAMKKLRDDALASMEGKTVTHKDITLNGMKGVESRATTSTTQGAQRGYFDAKKRRSILIGVVSTQKWNEPVATAFLDSLAIK